MKGYAKDTAVAYLFLAPVIVGIALFTAYPIVMSLFYSFSDFNGSYATVINFDNYIALFDGSSGEFFGFMRSLGITALYVVCSTALNLVLSYALALFLRRQVKVVVNLEDDEKEIREYQAEELKFKPRRKKQKVSKEEMKKLAELEK